MWAAKADRVAVLGPLVELGARVDADPYRGTPLIWAAANGRVAAIRALVELGADPNRRGTFGGPDHGEGVTALHLAAGSGRVEAVRALLELGADPTVRDALHESTPAGLGRARRARGARSHARCVALATRVTNSETGPVRFPRKEQG